jgi:hypothetical protein
MPYPAYLLFLPLAVADGAYGQFHFFSEGILVRSVVISY